MGWLEGVVIVILLAAIVGVSALGSRVRPPGVPTGEDTSRRAVFDRARRDWLMKRSPDREELRPPDEPDR